MSRTGSGTRRSWNETSEEEQPDRIGSGSIHYDDDNLEVDEENENDDDISDAASFPTQEDLESIIVHPPESVVSVGDVEVRSVSSFNIGMAHSHGGSGSATGGICMDTTTSSREVEDNSNRFEYSSAGGGGSSVGGMSEKSDLEHAHPVGRVMITTSMSMSTSIPASLSASAMTSTSLSTSKSSTGAGVVAGSNSGHQRHDDGHMQDSASDTRDVMNHIHMNMNLHHNMNIQERVLDTTNLNFPTTETVKSDIATVCSGSVVEDIDLASVGTTTHEHSITNVTTTNTNMNTNIPLASPGVPKRRGVEFAAETSTMWTTTAHTHTIFPARYSPQQSPTVTSLTATSITLNDMGPPLNRSLLERVGSLSSRAGSVRSFASSTGTPSRPSSVKSFGSVAASEVVHVDTDDCGGSMVGSEGHPELSGALSGCTDDANSEQSHHDNHHHSNQASTACSADKSPSTYKVTADPPLTFSTTTTMTMSAKAQSDEEVKVDNNVKLRLSVDNGRMSPGGTVYRGRGVRRYQGRFMNLPMKRFHQSAGGDANFALHSEDRGSEKKEFADDDRRSRRTDDEVWERSRGRQWGRDISRSRSRSRSRDRDRDQGMVIKRQKPRGSNNSKSPPPRNLQQSYDDSRNYRGSNRQHNNNSTNANHRRRNVQRTNVSPSGGQRYRNHSRRGRGGRYERGQGTFTCMTPRGARHGDTSRK